MRRRHVSWFVAATVLFGGFFAIAYLLVALYTGTLNSRWYPWKVHESKIRGNEVIAALQSYKRDHREYPAHLADLVPGYLVNIQQPTAGKQSWEYDTDFHGQMFDLRIEDNLSSVPRWYYRPDLQQWTFKSF